MAQTHICAVCGATFSSDEEYLNHKCTTGFKPTSIEHQDALTSGRASRIAEAALARGSGRTTEDVVE